MVEAVLMTFARRILLDKAPVFRRLSRFSMGFYGFLWFSSFLIFYVFLAVLISFASAEVNTCGLES